MGQISAWSALRMPRNMSPHGQRLPAFSAGRIWMPLRKRNSQVRWELAIRSKGTRLRWVSGMAAPGGLQQSSNGAQQASLLAIDTLVITTSARTIHLILW